MGTYVYTIRRKPIRVELDSGKIIEAYPLRYAFKSSYHGLSPRQAATLTCAEKVWERNGGPPQYVVLCNEDHPEPGDAVYEWAGLAYWADMDPIPGNRIAFLKEKGKRGRKIVWGSSRILYDLSYGKMIENTFFIVGSEQLFSTVAARAKAEDYRKQYSHVQLTHSTGTQSL